MTDPATLKLRYPEFSAVPDDTLQYWLTDAERSVDGGWPDADRGPALLMLAAHSLALRGFGQAAGAIPAGVTSFKSGAVSISVAESAASARAAGGYGSTSYGLEFQALQRRLFGGPRVYGFSQDYCW